jgi:predicted RNA-binding protein with PIN domain
MPYLVDGHNLVPRIAGMSLQDLDDEEKLLNLLAEFARVEQTNVEVYFDRGAPGHVGTRTAGRVKAVFVSNHTIADTQIIKRIHTLGGNVKNWVVVSSDQHIQTEARSAHARLLDSDAFASRLLAALGRKQDAGSGEPMPSAGEVDEWLKLFDGKN